MYKNGLTYGKCTTIVLLTHIIMLLAILLRGKYDTPQDILPLAVAVIGLDLTYSIVLRFLYRQMTYTLDFVLLLLINISVMFQSCFGGVGFAAKHYVTCIVALAVCQVGFLLTRNHVWIQSKKIVLYILLGVLILSILLLTGSRSMWINIGPISIQPSEFMKPVFVLICATSIREQHEKKKILFFYVSKEMMILTGRGGKFAALCALSLFLAAMGAVICIVIQNYFMLPVLAAGMGLIPFWYVLFTSHSYKKLMNNEIETGLSIITSSYLRSESIITAVEENIHYLNPPVADVFRGFLAETGMISADVKQALSNMKPKLDNYIFREWVDAAIACQDDKSLKSTLTPIIGKLSDMRIVAAELDYLMYEPFKEFITMAFLLVGNIPLLYFLNKDWYDVLVNTGFGKGILAVCLLVLLISFEAVIRLTKPVEYKR